MGVNDHDTFTGLTPLHKAAAEGALDQVVALMDDGADVDIQANGEVGFVLRAIRARMIAARGRASGERGLVAR
jgi:ankyrin repeat protein